MSFQKAEKAAAQKVQPPPREVLKELDDAVVHFLRNRVEWTRQISHIEAKLQGKQQEMETLDCYMKTQPRFGRKRKREEDHAALDSADAAALAAVDATAAAANFAEKEEPNITVIE
ncbi:expressed unknown protein [Seminavis robusta]|uniref:Uncharacterized protein n=1 Tax=Seminavis robusta TaxID=568900 RepID=A0A9N8EY91_9STRA|nr:expressed unknown protein [Seminavis robusta]CAB9529008.1 expressed unknown protein [Seminavis robusta]|eukprot:Sro2378_g325400.1 n/a (116) ;mRNA; r:9923-10348